MVDARNGDGGGAEFNDHSDPRAVVADNLPPGTRIGAYTIMSRVSRGGFGTVYRAVRGANEYALKIAQDALIDMEPQKRADFEARMRRELAALTSLSHPNIVRTYGFDTWPGTDGFVYIVLEYLSGKPLRQWAVAAKPSVRTLCRVFAEICSAIQAMHEQQIYHRDLKSENILVLAEEDGPRPVVIDFGIAKAETSGNLTTVSEMIGTVSHMTPEYVAWSSGTGRGEFKWGPAQDLHSLGFVMYEAFVGRRPFFATGKASDAEILEAIRTVKPPIPSTVNTRLPPKLDPILMTLLAKDPLERYASAADAQRELERAVAEYADASWDEPLELAAPPSSTSQTQKRRVPTQGPATVTAAVHADVPGLDTAQVGVVPGNLGPRLSMEDLERDLEQRAENAAAAEFGPKSGIAQVPAVAATKEAAAEPSPPDDFVGSGPRQSGASQRAGAMAGRADAVAERSGSKRAAVPAPSSDPSPLPDHAPEPEPFVESRSKVVAPAPREPTPRSGARPVVAPPAAAPAVPRSAEPDIRMTGVVDVATFRDPSIPTAVRQVQQGRAGGNEAAAEAGGGGSSGSDLPGGTAIRQRAALLETAKRAVEGSSKSKSKVPVPLLAALGVGMLLFMVLAVAAKSKPAQGGAGPVSLLEKVQAEAPATPQPVAPRAEPPPSAVPPLAMSADVLSPTSPPPPPDLPLGEPPPPPPSAGRRRTGGGEGGAIDRELESHYGGRPNAGATARAAPADDGPIKRSVAMTGPRDAAAGKKLGVPMGSHIPVKLLTPLDSRTVDGGWIEMVLIRPYVARGEVVLPARTVMYGRAGANGARFTITFTSLKLPDEREVPFKGYAVDRTDGQPGLVATRRIEPEPSKGPGVGEQIAKNTANIALGTITGGGAAGQAAQGAGQIVVSNAGGGAQGGGTGGVIMLDPGGTYEVWVQEAF